MPRRRSPKTRALHPRIAIAFDFDDTLAPDSMNSLLEGYGVDKHAYWKEHVHPRVRDGWDPIPAAFYALIEFSRSQKEPHLRLTRKRLAEHGRSLRPFPGVESTLNRLRRVAQRTAGVEVEYYIISSGIGEVIRNSGVARHCRNVWASDFHYDRTGEVSYIRKVISHTEKTRYLHNIARGIQGSHGFDRPLDLDPSVVDEDVCIPLQHIIYVGDGKTDVPCFSMINQHAGFALGVYSGDSAQKWGEDIDLSRGRRRSNLVPADFSPKSELTKSLMLAVESLCRIVSLRRMARGE